MLLLLLVVNAGDSRVPSPSSPKLTQCAHPALPGSLLCVLGRSQDTLKEQRLVGPQHLLCVTLPLALGTFYSSPVAQKGTRQIKSFTHHPYPVPTTSIPRGKKTVKQKQKKIFCTEIYFYYTKFVQYQKKTEKNGVHFFFIIVGKWCGSLFFVNVIKCINMVFRKHPVL